VCACGGELRGAGVEGVEGKEGEGVGRDGGRAWQTKALATGLPPSATVDKARSRVPLSDLREPLRSERPLCVDEQRLALRTPHLNRQLRVRMRLGWLDGQGVGVCSCVTGRGRSGQQPSGRL